jgi:hypothetical protein
MNTIDHDHANSSATLPPKRKNEQPDANAAALTTTISVAGCESQ